MASGVAMPLDNRCTGSCNRTSGLGARPTLFGTTLQQQKLSFYDQRTAGETEKDDDEEEVETNRRQKDTVQQQNHLLELAKERNDLDVMKSKLKVQRENLSQSQNNLQILEEACKYFKVDAGAASSETPAVNFERQQIDAVNQMSRGRVLGRRYGAIADSTHPFHLDNAGNRWEPVGRPLPANNCTPHAAVEISTQRFRDSRRLHHKDSTTPDYGSKAKLVSLPTSLVERYGTHLPPRIQHQFGTAVCRNLFADPDAFHPSGDVRPPAAVAVGSRQEAKTPGPGDGIGIRRSDAAAAVDALALGNLLRYNLGQTCDVRYDKGVTQTDFSPSVHRRQTPSTGKFRYRKNHLSKWAEQDAVRSQTTKYLDEKKMETR